MHWKIPAERRLKSRNCCLHSVKPANFPHKVIKCSEWLRRTNKRAHRTSVKLDESLARGHDSPWTTWRCLNRLRTGYTCSKEQRKKWQYFEMETQHVYAVLRQKISRTCCNAPFLHDHAHWMTFQSSTTQQSLAQKDDTMMMIEIVPSSIESINDVKHIAYIQSVRAKIMKMYTDTHTKEAL